MRISLLLRREPFGDILVSTLRNYWESRFGRQHELKWFARNPGPQQMARDNWQGWFGNSYLNFLATDAATDSAFDNLRAEYSRSTVWWRSLAQSFYVNLAVSRMARDRLAQVALGVYPDVPESEDTIILGGNRRLRILHPARMVTTVILKSGFPKSYLQNDLRIRMELNPDFSPRLIDTDPAAVWYDEEYVPGVPVNRLVQSVRQECRDEARRLLKSAIMEPTLKEVDGLGYLEEKCRLIEALVEGNEGSFVDNFGSLLSRIRQVGRKLIGQSATIPLAMTHGDFQEANILYDGDRVVVIDWESIAERHAAYDCMVLELQCRQVLDWDERLVNWIESAEVTGGDDWPGCDSSAAERSVTALFFILEELHFFISDFAEVEFVTSLRNIGQVLFKFNRCVAKLNGN